MCHESEIISITSKNNMCFYNNIELISFYMLEILHVNLTRIVTNLILQWVCIYLPIFKSIPVNFTDFLKTSVYKIHATAALKRLLHYTACRHLNIYHHNKPMTAARRHTPHRQSFDLTIEEQVLF